MEGSYWTFSKVERPAVASRFDSNDIYVGGERFSSRGEGGAII